MGCSGHLLSSVAPGHLFLFSPEHRTAPVMLAGSFCTAWAGRELTCSLKAAEEGAADPAGCRHSKALAAFSAPGDSSALGAALGHTDCVDNPGNTLGFDCLPTRDVAMHPGIWVDTFSWLEQLLAA